MGATTDHRALLSSQITSQSTLWGPRKRMKTSMNVLKVASALLIFLSALPS